MNTVAVDTSLLRLHTWAAERDHNHISINTVPQPPWMDYLRSRWPVFGIAWRQFFRILPIDLRPLLGPLPPKLDPKATILFALAYLDLAELGPEFCEASVKCLNRVLELRSNKTRHFAIRQNNCIYLKTYKASDDDISPLLTAWAGRLFLKAHAYTAEARYFDYARAVADYFVREHPRHDGPEGTYFYYDPSVPDRIYNASAEISSYLGAYGSAAGDSEARTLAESGLRFVTSRQNEDGSWFYGEGPRFRYIDNFHTAFLLTSLATAGGAAAAVARQSLERGVQYLTARLFRESRSGLMPLHLDPRFRPTNSNLIQRVDLRDAAASVVLFLELGDSERAERILHWSLNRMRSNRGTYYPEITLLWTNRIPYIEFQAWMLYCLARYRRTIPGANRMA